MGTMSGIPYKAKLFILDVLAIFVYLPVNLRRWFYYEEEGVTGSDGLTE